MGYMKVNEGYLQKVGGEVGPKYGKDAHYLFFFDSSMKGVALVPLASGYKISGGEGNGGDALGKVLLGSYSGKNEISLDAQYIGGLYGSRKATDWGKLSKEERDRLIEEAIQIL